MIYMENWRMIMFLGTPVMPELTSLINTGIDLHHKIKFSNFLKRTSRFLSIVFNFSSASLFYSIVSLIEFLFFSVCRVIHK